MDLDRYFTEGQQKALAAAELLVKEYDTNVAKNKISPEICAGFLLISLHEPVKKWYAPWRSSESFVSSVAVAETAVWERILDLRKALAVTSRHMILQTKKARLREHQINVLKTVVEGAIRNTKEDPTKELLVAALAVANEIGDDLKELVGSENDEEIL